MSRFWARNTKSAKLTEVLVDRMREEYASGVTQGALARSYGVSIGQVGRIVRNESWQRAQSSGLSNRELDEALVRLMNVQKEVNEQKSASAKMGDAIRAARGAAVNPDELVEELKGETDGSK